MQFSACYNSLWKHCPSALSYDPSRQLIITRSILVIEHNKTVRTHNRRALHVPLSNQLFQSNNRTQLLASHIPSIMTSAGSPTAKRVWFLDSPDVVQDVPAVEEYEGTWQTEDDRKKCQSEIIKTALLARDSDGSISPSLEQSEQVTTRGIEAICAGATRVQELLSAKNSVICAVLDEQQRQEMRGATTLDDVAIMVASVAANSGRFSAEALARASEDAAYVLREVRIEKL